MENSKYKQLNKKDLLRAAVVAFATTFLFTIIEQLKNSICCDFTVILQTSASSFLSVLVSRFFSNENNEYFKSTENE